jgi:regulator of sirC expression with transglutaminase-like and TPR domain
MSSKKGVFYSEEELMRIRLERTHEERLKILLQLIRTDRAFRKAKITYPDKK